MGLMAALLAPSAMAGLMRLDVENLTCYDWDTGEPSLGGSISFFIDETIADSDVLPDRGRYNGAIKNAQFHNFLNGESYSLDVDALNYLDLQSYEDMYTGIALRGSFKNKWGQSFLFDLWMEAAYKPDDYLHTLKSSVSVWNNSVLFNLLAPVDYFEGFGATNVSFKPVSQVPESGIWSLMMVGALLLAWQRLLRSTRSTTPVHGRTTT
jgi:hypothetical protein